MKIAVVGAGWAGLAAAVDLKAADHDVSVFEAGHTPGGRARRVARPGLAVGMDDAMLDNGQHILLGAYTESLDLMQRLGRDLDRVLWRLPLQIGSLDGTVRMQAPRWPAPWHALSALMSAHGLTWRDRAAAARLMVAVRRERVALAESDTSTVADWLAHHRQPAHLVETLWEPLCLAAMNTPIAKASAVLFSHVLRDSLAGTATASDLLLPRVDLSSLWPDAAAREVRMRYGQTIRAIGWGDDTVLVNGEAFDAAVLAIPPVAAARLIAPHARTPSAVSLVAQLRAFTYSPIATLVLQLATPYRLPMPMMMLRENRERGHDGQWIFDRSRIVDEAGRGQLTVVASAADGILHRDRDAAIAALVEQVREQAPSRAPLPPVIGSELFVEKRATFAAVAGLSRPGNATPWPRLVLAGDWTATGYPGVLEGAVRSGRQAARLFAVRRG